MRNSRLLAGLATGILLACVVIVPVPGRGMWLKVLQDFGHAIAFGGVAIAVLIWLRGVRRPAIAPGQYIVAFLIACALGAITELLQFVIERDPSWFDLRNDALGATVALGLAAAFDRRLRLSLRVGVASAALLLLAVPLGPVAQMFEAYQRRAALYPVLARFTDELSLYFMSRADADIRIAALPASLARSPGEQALQVDFGGGDYPGVVAEEPSPDWRGYRTLVADIVNPTDQQLDLTLRVHDAHHDNRFVDRFNAKFTIAPHSRVDMRWSLADIEAAPAGRSMDLSRIAGAMLFRNRGSAAARLYLVDLRLEP